MAGAENQRKLKVVDSRSVVELSSSRSHDAPHDAMDGPGTLAASPAHGEAGQHVSQTSHRNPSADARIEFL
jgi:hypothetical protein